MFFLPTLLVLGVAILHDGVTGSVGLWTRCFLHELLTEALAPTPEQEIVKSGNLKSQHSYYMKSTYTGRTHFCPGDAV